MARLLRRAVADRSGVAAMEFGLLLPIFAMLCVGAIDFGLAFDARLRLSSAVGDGAQFAFLTGAGLQAGQVQTVVQSATSLSPVSVSVSYDPAACYCLAGPPAALAAQSCATACANGTPAGKYVSITATYTYQPIFPSFQLLSSPVLTERATARVQ